MPRLTEQEKQEIVRYIEADKPLPEKYRFLLFEDKREVELVRVSIVETKGEEDVDVPFKMQRLRQWCEDINRVQSDVEYDFLYVDEESFEVYRPESFRQLVDGFREYKE